MEVKEKGLTQESGHPVRFVGDLGQVNVIWALVLSSVRRLVGPADLSPLAARRFHLPGDKGAAHQTGAPGRGAMRPGWLVALLTH